MARTTSTRAGGCAFPERWPSTEGEVLASEVRATVAAALESSRSASGSSSRCATSIGHTPDEVCAMLDISTANQRVLLHRARAAVRGHLEPGTSHVTAEV